MELSAFYAGRRPSSTSSVWTKYDVQFYAGLLAGKALLSEKRFSLTFPPAIVTNAKNRIAYNITRSLGRKGIPVYTADFLPWAMSHASIYSRGHFLYPSPFSRQEEFIDCLVKKAKAFPGCVLIPAFEETFLISKHKERFRGLARMVVPDYDQILTAHNKDRWEVISALPWDPGSKVLPGNGIEKWGKEHFGSALSAAHQAKARRRRLGHQPGRFSRSA